MFRRPHDEFGSDTEVPCILSSNFWTMRSGVTPSDTSHAKRRDVTRTQAYFLIPARRRSEVEYAARFYISNARQTLVWTTTRQTLNFTEN